MERFPFSELKMEEVERQKLLMERLVEMQRLELEKEMLAFERHKERIAADRKREKDMRAAGKFRWKEDERRRQEELEEEMKMMKRNAEAQRRFWGLRILRFFNQRCLLRSRPRLRLSWNRQ